MYIFHLDFGIFECQIIMAEIPKALYAEPYKLI